MSISFRQSSLPIATFCMWRFPPQVLAQRKGIPITLAIIQCSVANRIGLKVEPVGAPCHFLTKIPNIGDSDEELFMDPFHAGKLMTLPVGSDMC